MYVFIVKKEQGIKTGIFTHEIHLSLTTWGNEKMAQMSLLIYQVSKISLSISLFLPFFFPFFLSLAII